MQSLGKNRAGGKELQAEESPLKRGQATVLLLQVTISPLVSPRQAPRLDCPTVPPRVLQVQLLGVFSAGASAAVGGGQEESQTEEPDNTLREGEGEDRSQEEVGEYLLLVVLSFSW